MEIKKNKLNIFLFGIFVFGTILRSYNVNFNDLWSDEMVSFWVSDPNISFKETLLRLFSSNWMVVYEISLKYFHSLFGYDVHVSRYFSSLISLFSLIYFAILLRHISNEKSQLLGFFLLSINIYHIAYSIELRSYILTFLLVTIFIYLNFKNKKSETNLNNLFLLKINFVLIIMLFCHPFTLLVPGSLVVFKIIEVINYKKINRQEILFIISLVITSCVFLIIYFQTTMKIMDPSIFKGISPDWMWQVKPSFYTNFYFSKFFGSRLLGIIYLATLLYCLFRFRKKIIKEFDIYAFFIILIFISYLVPLCFGYLFNPILIDRYIFFILIPIICVISYFIFYIEPIIVRYFIISLICLLTFFNNLFFESSFKQFYTDIYPGKHEIKKTLKYISNQSYKDFTFKRDDRYSINTNIIYENYLINYLKKINSNSKYFSFKKKSELPSKFWLIYITDTTDEIFKVPKKFENYYLLESKKFNRVEVHLLSTTSN